MKINAYDYSSERARAFAPLFSTHEFHFEVGKQPFEWIDEKKNNNAKNPT